MAPSSLLPSLLKHSLKLQNNLNTLIKPFSSLTSTRKKWTYFSDDDTKTETSPVYNHALKFQRPSTIKYGQNSVNNRSLNFKWPSSSQYQKQPFNSISLIGTIEFPLKKCQTKYRFGVYTTLRVKASAQSNKTFRVLLKMWDEMAEMSMDYVKPDDLVYVSGHLGSNVKDDKDGNPRMFYEVIVKELNYVAQYGEKPMHQKPQKLDLQGKQRNRLRLWQVFFANPYEWRDLRMSKTTPNQPDFKNMTTGEALWLMPSDPPWIKRQLQFLDCVLVRQNLGGHMSFPSLKSLLTNNTTEGIGEPSGDKKFSLK